MFTVTPGLQPAMSGAAYHAAPGVSKSKLDDISSGAAVHYWDKHINPDRPVEERSESLILGDAIHAAIGEPDTVANRFMVVPADAPKRPDKRVMAAKNPSLESRGAIDYWKAFLAENAAKTILKPEQMEIVLACRDAAFSDPLVAGLLEGAKFEQTYYAIDHETGALIKCRLDGDRLEDEGLILDFKSTEDASPDAFWRSAKKFRYDVQDPWYCDVVDQALGAHVAEQFAFIAIEKKRPFAVAVYYYEPEERQAGYIKARDDLRRIRDLTARYGAERWPNFTENGPQALKSGWDRARAH